MNLNSFKESIYLIADPMFMCVRVFYYLQCPFI